mgnify:CR=1 FL=1
MGRACASQHGKGSFGFCTARPCPRMMSHHPPSRPPSRPRPPTRGGLGQHGLDGHPGLEVHVLRHLFNGVGQQGRHHLVVGGALTVHLQGGEQRSAARRRERGWEREHGGWGGGGGVLAERGRSDSPPQPSLQSTEHGQPARARTHTHALPTGLPAGMTRACFTICAARSSRPASASLVPCAPSRCSTTACASAASTVSSPSPMRSLP